MVDLGSLAKRAAESEDGEAYAPIAKATGFRIGVGARVAHGRDPEFFVEVVLDPFPERPAVRPGQTAEQGALAERLRRRGYSLSCDDAGVLTCERTLRESAARKEIEEIPRMLRSERGRRRTPGPGRDEEG